jgi:hypothetical protein
MGKVRTTYSMLDKNLKREHCGDLDINWQMIIEFILGKKYI